ncbi:TPA: thiol:disulfide interchange protein DsbA/DsbL [Vibrio parahaemolyticus]|uniref:thiol:disulfide interchange protein DsbA/DsbL n=1 Tax=Vibrio parahaemolyticus TaxID=670 RepID=UPI0003ED90C0|nr:thiol:disulfide interchange protein DsbA/DsbL [Vibrio parahaemolyticus]AHJ01545.1 Periplasmic thiol:disulfide interchange protein DsbA [Vibrio parahaemolyticus UCM-V493]EGQ8412538.1 thioredoxin domain-containing protein [Vibrio parahaemolyticus]EGQ8959621.1 thioredoxin domain-containing protein [Vibrio parahaemolyticus]EGQ9058737.1 thioredoxin domain-containing protein [Vibrio parahaemolyticus]EGQ9158105.1 thioredoxin domain-containing protein [Vibrio parahaemolyticus]
MKKLLALCSTLLLAFSAHAAQFEEGKHYKVLNVEKATKPTVTEFFSFYCPHCYKFESVIENLKPALPKEARFEKVHVAFMGADMAVPMAKSYATMVSLGVEDKMVPAMFAQIHQKRQAPKNEDELKKVFTDNGVDGNKFDAAYNSFAVSSMQKRFDKQFKESTLTGVPGVVVNNKYIVIPNEVRSYAEYSELVNYLLTL